MLEDDFRFFILFYLPIQIISAFTNLTFLRIHMMHGHILIYDKPVKTDFDWCQ